MPSSFTLHQNALRENAGPATPWLCAGLLLTGIGTVILGPLLPHLAATWHLNDTQSGALLAAKFIGAFAGGITVPRRVRIGLASGAFLSLLGFGALGFCGGAVTAAIALFVSGFGVGQIIVSANVLGGRRYRVHTGSALTLLNFFWSLGAVLSGALVGALLPHIGLRWLMLGYAAAFLLVGLVGELNLVADVATEAPSPTSSRETTPWRVLGLFALLLFLYGGLETCIADWLTTYSVRYSGRLLLGGQVAVILFWIAITAGRALSSAAMRRVSERTVQITAILLSAIFVSGLLFPVAAAHLALTSTLLGLAMAAYFPVSFGLLMRWNPRPAQAGAILAVSGLGAAGFLWLTGVVSTHLGSLRQAMVVPLMLALALIAVSLMLPRAPQAAFPDAGGV